MIIIINYGIGNLGSIKNMLRKIGAEAEISSDPKTFAEASAFILPGVGSFDHCVQKLHDAKFLPIIEERVASDKIPLLGICVGMQMLFERSEEGHLEGLSWIPGEVKRFSFPEKQNEILKIPHMGWNEISPRTPDLLLDGLDKENRFYFVHSYHVQCQDSTHILATAHYGYDFACIVRKNNIYGVQFHPEKSHKFGMLLLKNFIEKIC